METLTLEKNICKECGKDINDERKPTFEEIFEALQSDAIPNRIWHVLSDLQKKEFIKRITS